jgi:hypothetical protein
VQFTWSFVYPIYEVLSDKLTTAYKTTVLVSYHHAYAINMFWMENKASIKGNSLIFIPTSTQKIEWDVNNITNMQGGLQ